MDQASIYWDNEAYKAAVLTLINTAEAEIRSSYIKDNILINSSGVAELSGSSTLFLNFSTVQNNNSKLSNGVIFIEQKLIFIIENTSFFEISSDMEGSVIYSTYCSLPGSYMSSSRLYSNLSTSLCAYQIQSYTRIRSLQHLLV